MMWKELVQTYFEAWTADGISPANANAKAIRDWLTDSDLWTETDRRTLEGMDGETITRLSADIENQVRECLGITLEAEVERAKVYHETMGYLYTLATTTNNSDIFEAYSRMARAEADLFSAAVYYDPAVVRPEDDPADLEPWVLTTETWNDGEGDAVIAYTDDHVLLLDARSNLSCYTDDEFMPERMLWSFGPDEIPEHLKPLYKTLIDERGVN